MSYSPINTIDVMRNIIGNLRQAEIQNAGLAGRLAKEEIDQAVALNHNIGNVSEMAGHANQLAGFLHQFNSTANNNAVQLGNLEKMLDELEKHLH